MNLLDKVALVTGGAKRLGREICLALAHEGCDIVIHYRNSRDEADALAREIKVPFLDLGLGGGQYFVRDLWRQRCEGKHSGFYAVKVPPHGTHLVRIRPVSCSKCD